MAVRRRARAVLLTGIVIGALAASIRFGNDLARTVESSAPSVSRGSPERGSLEHGKRLPSSGPNFVAYSYFGAMLGRNSVDGAVRATVLDAYTRMRNDRPDVRWVYGETGWPRGGPFPPHKTHENGRSVDFFVPARDDVGHSVRVPTWPWTKFGYALNFDAHGDGTGTARGLHIDFPAIGAHLAALADAARAHGLDVDVVIFAPELESRLMATPEGRALRGRIRFSRTTPWVRHDEHYHVNFRTAR